MAAIPIQDMTLVHFKDDITGEFIVATPVPATDSENLKVIIRNYLPPGYDQIIGYYMHKCQSVEFENFCTPQPCAWPLPINNTLSQARYEVEVKVRPTERSVISM